MHTNQLVHEKSPYLLQHAHNPVDWLPWGEAAFEKARREDKPIFLSVGYSTCHWCHVMERESFENGEIARVLNEQFVPVKVDREERPDVDRIYMLFVQATTGSGGWPMSVFLTPDLKPFYGGTYFPPDNRYGRPGFAFILERIAEAWRNERGRLVASAEEIVERLRYASDLEAGTLVVGPTALDSGFFQFRRVFDSAHGGFGGAPKFPRPSVHDFLLRYHLEKRNQEALDMVVATLRAMARGGMYDQLGGGFHRYSVDERWFVPHFEKMLYDQAQLAVSYLEAYQLTRDADLARVARETLDYVLRDMTHPDGGFYSAEDADSVIDPAEPHEKGEGAFYVWTWEELEAVLGEEPARWAAYRWGAEPGGNVSPQQDPHNEFTGRSILFEAHSIEETAARFEKDPVEMADFFAGAREKLLAARAQRVRPHLDDKILAGWNGLMISAFAYAAQALGEPRYEEAARRAAEFLLARLYDPRTRTLLRRYRDGEAAIPAFLDDYASVARALIDLYETTFDVRYLELALELAGRMRELFEDTEQGGFFTTAAGSGDLVLRVKDDYDGAEPAGNSLAVLVLLRLARYTGRAALHDSAQQALRLFAPRLEQLAQSLPSMLAALSFNLAEPREIVLAGEPGSADLAELLAVVRDRFLPHKILLQVSEATRERLARILPAVASMTPIAGKAAAYVCRDYACQLPVTAGAELAELLR